MKLINQNALILTNSDEDIHNLLTKTLSGIGITFTKRETFKELRNTLEIEKFELLFLLLNDINVEELNHFFQIIKNQKDTLLIFGIGPAVEKKPDSLDFYFTKEEIKDSSSLFPIIDGIMVMTQKLQLQSELSAMLIHDIRSPLQSILSYIELLESGVFGQLNEGQKK